jgi:hypothetical protein
MALFSKPVKIPRWADTGTITEPSESQKNSGWLFQQIPPSAFENWKENLTGSWFKWLNERLFDGLVSSDFTVTAVAGTTTTEEGGDVVTEGGNAFNNAGTTAKGGDWFSRGGEGFGTGAGGDFFGRGGNAQNASGGVATLAAGDGNFNGSPARLLGGNALTAGNGGAVDLLGGNAAGTDLQGGTVLLEAGNSTGNQSSRVLLRAAKGLASGTAVRSAEDFLSADGSYNGIIFYKGIITGPGIGGEVLNIESINASGSAAYPLMNIIASSTASMVDGFGVAQEFYLKDISGVYNRVGEFIYQRKNADDVGVFNLWNNQGGVLGRGIYIDEASRVGIGLPAGDGNPTLAGGLVVNGNLIPRDSVGGALGDATHRWFRLDLTAAANVSAVDAVDAQWLTLRTVSAGVETNLLRVHNDGRISHITTGLAKRYEAAIDGGFASRLGNPLALGNVGYQFFNGGGGLPGAGMFYRLSGAGDGVQFAETGFELLSVWAPQGATNVTSAVSAGRRHPTAHNQMGGFTCFTVPVRANVNISHRNVVAVISGNDRSVTPTTALGQLGSVGVWTDLGVLAGDFGHIAVSGVVEVVAGVGFTRGDYLQCSNVAGAVQQLGAFGPACIGLALTTAGIGTVGQMLIRFGG